MMGEADDDGQNENEKQGHGKDGLKLLAPSKAHSAKLSRDCRAITGRRQNVGGVRLLLLLFVVVVVECLAVVVVISAMWQDGHKASPCTGRHHKPARTGGQGVTVKAGGFLAFFIIANRDEGRDGTKGEAFGLADMGGE